MKIKNIFRKRGFTLIELLVVVLIIGVLAAIAIAGYKKAVEKSKVSDALNTIQAVAKSEHNWYLTRNNYTKDFSDLDIDLSDKDGNKADNETLETTFYTYHLLDGGILASRNNEEYSIYRDYDNSMILCTPSSHYICQDLGDFTKKPCDDAGMAWAKRNTTCYKDDESRCKGLYNNLWNGDFCGYTDTKDQTLDEAMYCVGGENSGCKNSVINDGGTCIGNHQNACHDTTINDGGLCLSTGDGHHGACKNATVNNGGTCIADSQDGCMKSTINAGGTCWGRGGGDYEYKNFMCKEVTLNGGTCIGDAGRMACSAAIVNDGGKCIANAEYGCINSTVNNGGQCHANAARACEDATYNGTGCCKGEYCPSSAPNCDCPIDGSTGQHKTSC